MWSTLVIDFLLPWNWEYDAPFVALMQQACAVRGLTFLALGEAELDALPARLNDGSLSASCALDRAWEDEPEFVAHELALRKHVPNIVNVHQDVRNIINKPRTHYLLMQNGFFVPYLMILPSFEKAPRTELLNLAPLGLRFSAKGAHSGGSGVLHPINSWGEVQLARQDWPADETILQAWITPRMLGDRPAWFRIFYAGGRTLPVWQNDRTHIQTPVSADDETRFGLTALHSLTARIAELSRLNAFSTEIAQDEKGQWIVVDYVNEPCDYRPQSSVYNGVPDDTLHAIVDGVADWAKTFTVKYPP